jgi:FlaA1/EpsC-like NDP-sugar epimerase
MKIADNIFFKIPGYYKKIIAISVDLMACLLSVWISYGLSLDAWGGFSENLWWTFLISAVLQQITFAYFRQYQAVLRYIGSAALHDFIFSFLIYGSIFFCILTLIGVDGIPRSIGVIQPMLLFAAIGASRYVVRHLLRNFMQPRKFQSRIASSVLIYGSGAAGRDLLTTLNSSSEIVVKGFVDDFNDLTGRSINGIKVYDSKDLNELVQQLGITDVLLAIPSTNYSIRKKVIDKLYGLGVRVRTLPDIFEMTSGLIGLSDLHDLNMDDLLGRVSIPPDTFLMEKSIYQKVVLVTGAGGSIGSEICRQSINCWPKRLVLLDSSEYALYLLYEELKKYISEQIDSADQDSLPISLVPILGSVQDKSFVFEIFRKYLPNTVFHAAAYKHVPLVEENFVQGIRNNVFGTLNCVEASEKFDVDRFILISTDKAVRPTNFMGASKRVSELILQAKSEAARLNGSKIIFSMVRFGNVLGSSGSVIPLFSKQIMEGGPVTLTHKEVTRYFMTIPEAAQLVIQSSGMATGGDVFVLDMGNPVRIYDLAVRIIYLSGHLPRDDKNPNGDIEILTVGLRPGEKLYEELLIGSEPRKTDHPKIMMAHESYFSWCELALKLEELHCALSSQEKHIVTKVLVGLVPEYQPH